MTPARLVAALVVSACTLGATTRLLVTVFDPRTGKPADGLKAEDFVVRDEGEVRPVEAVAAYSGPVDYVLLVDTSLLGAPVQPVAESIVAQLGSKEEMAVVAFHTSAELVQDFTSSRESLLHAIAGLKFGNEPRILDAVYATIQGGFRASPFRRVVVLVTAGAESASRVSEREVIRLARRNGVSVYSLYVMGQGRGMLERLARETGGAALQLGQKGSEKPAVTLFNLIRSASVLTLSGNLALGENLSIQIKRPERWFVSGLPLD